MATTRQKRREQRLQAAQLDRLTFKHQRLIAKEISRTMRGVSISDPTSINEAETDHQVRLEKLFARMWNESGDQMVEQVFGEQKKAILESFQPTVGTNSIMRDYLRIFGVMKIQQVASTTIKQIRNIISQGIDQGLSERETSRLLREKTVALSASRAQTIARTETHAAANYAVNEAFKSTGAEAKREWVAAEDERTREDHSFANGQVVELNQPFNVGGEELMYPGDPSGSPENVVNCRCAVVFVFD